MGVCVGTVFGGSPVRDSGLGCELKLVLNALTTRPRDMVEPVEPAAALPNSYLFKYIVLAQIVVYMEAGAVPALLQLLTLAFSLSFTEKGFLGGVVYLAISFAAPLASFLFSRYSAKRVLIVSLLLNNAMVILFALVPEHSDWRNVLIGIRALIGATQSFLAVYLPVWIDLFAPPEKVTRWSVTNRASTCGYGRVGGRLGAVWSLAVHGLGRPVVCVQWLRERTRGGSRVSEDVVRVDACVDMRVDW